MGGDVDGVCGRGVGGGDGCSGKGGRGKEGMVMRVDILTSD